MGAKTERGARTRAPLLPFPRRPRSLALAPLRPSPRALLVALSLVAVSAASYAAARSTSIFAVTTITVRGASGDVARDVRTALRPVVGTSLLALPARRVERAVAGIPTVAAASYDRAFPNTLVVFVEPERPVAVLRRGAEAWLLSERGRVTRVLPRTNRPPLPRIWAGRDVPVELGAIVEDARVAGAVRALRAARPARREIGRITTVRSSERELTLLLERGGEIRLGNASALRLKVAVAARILWRARYALRYLDVSVPARPVGRTLNSDVEAEG